MKSFKSLASNLQEKRICKVTKGDKERMVNKQELNTYKQMGWKEVKEEVELDEVSDKKLDAYRQKAFADQPAGDDGSDKYRKRKFGRDLAFDKQTGRAKVLATKEEVELSENPQEEKPMMMGALRTMSHNLTGIAKYIEKTSDPEEWFQNKLAAAANELQTLYGYAVAETMEMDEPKEYNESELRDALNHYFTEENYSVDQINDLTEEEINELIGKIIGGAAKLAAKGAYRAVVNKQGNSRFSTAGRADSAEAKAKAAEKKNKDRERIKAARDRLTAAQSAARS